MWQWSVLLSLFTHFLHSHSRWSCRQPIVEVTVSPLVNTTSLHSLVISWSMETVLAGDHVTLHISNSKPLYRAEINSTSGWLDTGIQENLVTLKPLSFEEQCDGYWAALRSGNSSELLDFSCLGTSPRWMEQNRDALQNMSLRSLFLPGTHNSAAYLEIERPAHELITQKYIYNQGESVLKQLIYGARVLDLRVGYYPSTSEVWFTNHGIIKLRPLSQILDEIVLFANMTQEIVILDFHRFPVGFNKDSKKIHQELVKYLEVRLSGYLVPPSVGWSTKLSSIWHTGYQIILSYNYDSSLNTKYVWPPVVQKWGNAQTVSDLKQYLANVMKRTYPYAWSVMAELTPSTLDIITGRLGSLRQMANIVNCNVTDWFRGDWGAICNIVSVDFLRGSGLVRSAVKWNLRRSRGTMCDV